MSHPDHEPSAAARQLQAGLDLQAGGFLDEAMAAFRQGLAAASDGPPGQGQDKEVADLHFRLGNACLLRGDLDPAAENYKAALRINTSLTSCWCNLGNVYLRQDRAQDAIAIFLHALSLDSSHWAARSNLVEALVVTRQFIIARGLLLEMIVDRPQDAKLRHQLGKVHFELNDIESALASLREAIAIDPQDADSNYWIGGILQRTGDDEGAQRAYAAAARLRPLIRKPAKTGVAAFRVLALYAPFGGNTPTEYLFRDASYDVNTLALFSDQGFDAEALKPEADLVVNLISDADQADAADGMLSVAADLVDRINKTTLNDPRKISRTTRESVAAILQGIAGCRVPRVLRCGAGADMVAMAREAAWPVSFPVLARPAGTHGGDDFEMIGDIAGLEDFAARFAASDRYLIEYIDYRSRDGFFRKYRFIFVGDEILPYHLAIGDSWKLHHDNTDMENHLWMQQEEAAFLDHPESVFTPANYAALRAIRDAVGLDYSGIDCGLNAAGELVVFEANASMLVHDHNERFPYKAGAVQRIKLAFDAMLHRRALAARLVDAPPQTVRQGPPATAA
ncbi:MAG: tetratricopeptide repeat protein [Xanthobacteraceae bacterium]|nr:tetratricopeptide repeat protein [Xanthobacteraceae bacterium]